MTYPNLVNVAIVTFTKLVTWQTRTILRCPKLVNYPKLLKMTIILLDFKKTQRLNFTTEKTIIKTSKIPSSLKKTCIVLPCQRLKTFFKKIFIKPKVFMTGCDVSTCIYHLSYKTHQYICDLTSRNKKTTIKETATARHRKEK